MISTLRMQVRGERGVEPALAGRPGQFAQVLGYVHDESIPRQVRERRLREVIARLRRDGG